MALSDAALGRLRAAADEPDLSGTRYELIRRIDGGGMGTVWAVRDRELAREVALKVLDAPDPTGELAARLAREARHLARLEHPNIVPVHDAGTLPDGRPFYVMKLIRGERLDAWRARGPSRPEALRLFATICRAVAFAHAEGVVHRDLKPANVMVGAFGEAVVMDWGVAKSLGVEEPPRAGGESRDAVHTAHGAVLGTPGYMAPEQAAGDVGRVGPRADVHALGALLSFLVTGTHPHEPGGGVPAVAPAPLQSICAAAMAPEPAARYDSAMALALDVERFLDGGRVAAHREGVLERLARVARRHLTLIVLVAAYLAMRALVVWWTGR